MSVVQSKDQGTLSYIYIVYKSVNISNIYFFLITSHVSSPSSDFSPLSITTRTIANIKNLLKCFTPVLHGNPLEDRFWTKAYKALAD